MSCTCKQGKMLRKHYVLGKHNQTTGYLKPGSGS